MGVCQLCVPRGAPLLPNAINEHNEPIVGTLNKQPVFPFCLCFKYGRASRLQGIIPLHEHKGKLKREAKVNELVFSFVRSFFFFMSVYMI